MPRIKPVPTRHTKLAIDDVAFPYSEIVIDGKTYKMCFSNAGLRLAETRLREQGFREVNILGPMLERTFTTLSMLFAVSLNVYHPELDYRITRDWLNQENILDVIIALDKAWKLSHDDGSEAKPDPQVPAR